MEMIFHSRANKTHFHKKGCALGLILKVRVFKNPEVAYSFLSPLQDKASTLLLGYLRPCVLVRTHDFPIRRLALHRLCHTFLS